MLTKTHRARRGAAALCRVQFALRREQPLQSATARVRTGSAQGGGGGGGGHHQVADEERGHHDHRDAAALRTQTAAESAPAPPELSRAADCASAPCRRRRRRAPGRRPHRRPGTPRRTRASGSSCAHTSRAVRTAPPARRISIITNGQQMIDAVEGTHPMAMRTPTTQRPGGLLANIGRLPASEANTHALVHAGKLWPS